MYSELIEVMVLPRAQEAPWLSILVKEEVFSLSICKHKATILRICVDFVLFHAQNLIP